MQENYEMKLALHYHDLYESKKEINDLKKKISINCYEDGHNNQDRLIDKTK